MFNQLAVAKKLFTSFVAILASFSGIEVAISNPVLIDPSSQNQINDYNINGGVASMTFALITRLLAISSFQKLLVGD